MKREHKNITIDFIKRKEFLKKEIKKLILKSIFQNRCVANSKRFFLKTLAPYLTKKSAIAFQKKRCVLTGQSNSVYKKFDINRHVIKTLNNQGSIQGVAIKKW